MDLHKPKPWHGVREFLKEYLIIVVGVLTALGAEQVVELVHRNETIAEAKRALNTEVTFDLEVYELMAAEGDCLIPRLDEIARWTTSMEAGRPIRAAGSVQVPQGVNYRTSVWHVATLGAVSQMKFEDRVAYGHLYDAIENNEILRRANSDRWIDLSELFGAERLTPDQLRHLRAQVQRLRTASEATRRNWERLARDGRGMGLRVRPLSAGPDGAKRFLDPICRPLLAE